MSKDFESESLRAARIKYLEKENKFLTRLMWIAWAGWTVTAIMFMYFMG